MPIRLSTSVRGAAHGAGAFGVTAERLRRAGDVAGAIDLCRQGLAQHPGHVGARVTLGLSLMATGRDDEAFSALEEALRLAPDNLAAIRGLAELHERGVGSEMVDPAMFDLADSPESAPAATPAVVPELHGAPEPAELDPAVAALVAVADEDEVREAAAAPLVPPVEAEVVSPVVVMPVDTDESDLATAFAEPAVVPVTAPALMTESPGLFAAPEGAVPVTASPDPFAGLRLDDLDPELPAEDRVSLADDFSLEDVVSALDAPIPAATAVTEAALGPGPVDAPEATAVPPPRVVPHAPAAAAQVIVAAAVSAQPVAVLTDEPAAVLEEWLARIHTRRRQILSEYAAS